ncbi:MAG: hypothetical protein LQ345_005327 [Seirophora villosa]|nr:MAG: hypothetical protein LQ345_005327 [Seirophora villosa]
MQSPELTVFKWLFNDQYFTINNRTPFFAVSGHQLCTEDVWMIHAARYPGHERSWEDIAHALEWSGNTFLSEQKVFYIDSTRPPRRPIEPSDVESEYRGCLHLLRHHPGPSHPGPVPNTVPFYQKLMERFYRALNCYEQRKNDVYL